MYLNYLARIHVAIVIIARVSGIPEAVTNSMCCLYADAPGSSALSVTHEILYVVAG